MPPAQPRAPQTRALQSPKGCKGLARVPGERWGRSCSPWAWGCCSSHILPNTPVCQKPFVSRLCLHPRAVLGAPARPSRTTGAPQGPSSTPRPDPKARSLQPQCNPSVLAPPHPHLIAPPPCSRPQQGHQRPPRATKEHPGPPKQPAGCSHHPHGGHHSPAQGSGSTPAPRAGGRDPSSHLSALRGRVTGTPAASGRAQRSRCRRGIWGSPTRLAQQQSEELLPPHGCRELPRNPRGRVSIPQQANYPRASAPAAPPPASPAPRSGDGADSNSWYLPPQGCGFTTFPPI